MGVLKMDKPAAILLDIEGTMTDISFVSKVLFPFIKANVSKYFEENYNKVETQELIKRMRESRQSASEDEAQQLPRIEPSSAPRKDIIRSVSEYALANIKLKRRISEIKQMQILVWVWGYEKKLIKGHVYDEVTTTMHHWKTKNRITLYVFSSGMIAAQQLLLCCTNHGNCIPLIAEFFDSAVGEKTDPTSFRQISKKIDKDLSSMLFLTDNPKEAIAAVEAGCKSVIVQRPGNRIRGLDEVKNRIQVITSFEEIAFK